MNRQAEIDAHCGIEFEASAKRSEIMILNESKKQKKKIHFSICL